MELIAGRFLEGGDPPVDLATGERVLLRRLAVCDPSDERRWSDTCAWLSCLWHEDMPQLIDHGLLPDGRFEAYTWRPAGSMSRARANAAVHAFVMRHAVAAGGGNEGRALYGKRLAARHAPRLGIRLLTPSALAPVIDILEERRSGAPVSVFCAAPRGAGATTFLRMVAAEGRKRGYVPVSVRTLERWPSLATALRGRTWLLLCDAGDPLRLAHGWLLHLSSKTSQSHILLATGQLVFGAPDVLLRLEPFPAARLTASIHVHPEEFRLEDIQRAAAGSGGLPGRFLDMLRRDRETQGASLRVAEAQPAYGTSEEAADAVLEHPWSDLIASAVRVWASGRRVAAERDLRQIAAAARRRQIERAAAAAEIELARVLVARGKISEARTLLVACVDACRTSESLSLSASITLAGAHLEDGVLESAESAYRVCRPRAPELAALGLTRTLCWQARYEEAEHAVGPARDAADPRVRAAATALLATIALGQRDLPAAARAAAQALATAAAHDFPETAANAAALLVSVHGQLGDAESVERHARSAVQAARRTGHASTVLAIRAAVLEAEHRCGCGGVRRRLERLLRIAAGAPALVRAGLWSVASRVHPVEHVRAEYEERVRAFVSATGARALLRAAEEPAGATLGRDVAALLAIHEGAPTPRDTLERVAGWVRERIDARAVLVCDSEGAGLARSGPTDTIAAARRVLVTRASQPPWASQDGLESAVIIRHANVVRGALACRWPLSRRVTSDVFPVLSAAASIVGPALSALAERAAVQAASPDGMIGRSSAIERVRELVTRVAPSPFPVIIEGESGAGKEVVARAIHQASPRRLRPCVAINCAALTEDLLEAELFGHARGAFTGAHAERAGLLEQADDGTLFLDEIGELSPRAQAKLLRVLQDGEVRRIGENHARKVDVRVIAASNRALQAEADAGRFRSDLLFRLAVVRIHVPSLRERPEDIPLIAAHYWESAAARAGSRAVLTREAVAALARHDWPGNVRELQNIIAALAVHVPRGAVKAAHVGVLLAKPDGTQPGPPEAVSVTLDDARRDFERRFVAATLARCGGRHGAAARQLGISRQGLAKLLKRLGIHENHKGH